MVKTKLDELNLNILRELQKDAKMSMRALSKKIATPVSTLHRRIKKLEDNNVIKYYSAIIDPKAVDMNVTAFMLAQVEYRKDVDKIAESLKKIRGMQEVHYAIGEWDILMKLKIPTLDDYYKFSAEKALQLEGVSNTTGIIAPKTFKEEPIVQI